MTKRDLKKKKKSKLGEGIETIILVVLIFFCMQGVVEETSISFKLKEEHQNVILERDEINQQIEDNVKLKQLLQDENYLELYAKGSLLISEDGEQIFVVEKDEENKEVETDE